MIYYILYIMHDTRYIIQFWKICTKSHVIFKKSVHNGPSKQNQQNFGRYLGTRFIFFKVTHKKKQSVASFLQACTCQILNFAKNPRQSQVWQWGGGHRTEKNMYWKGGGTPHIPYWSGDTAHTLWGWGHRTTLKEKA